MKYSEAQENLMNAFRDLARAKQDLILLGGTVDFAVHREELHMSIEDGPTASFPLTVDTHFLGLFQKENPQHEYKE